MEQTILLTQKEMTAIAVPAVVGKNGMDIRVLYTREQTTLADYFVLCTGASSTQVKALADAVEEAMSRAGEEPHHVEGHRGGEWTLLDYSAVVVHVFTEQARQFYALERLWSDAQPVELAQYLDSAGQE